MGAVPHCGPAEGVITRWQPQRVQTQLPPRSRPVSRQSRGATDAAGMLDSHEPGALGMVRRFWGGKQHGAVRGPAGRPPADGDTAGLASWPPNSPASPRAASRSPSVGPTAGSQTPRGIPNPLLSEPAPSNRPTWPWAGAPSTCSLYASWGCAAQHAEVRADQSDRRIRAEQQPVPEPGGMEGGRGTASLGLVHDLRAFASDMACAPHGCTWWHPTRSRSARTSQ